MIPISTYSIFYEVAQKIFRKGPNQKVPPYTRDSIPKDHQTEHVQRECQPIITANKIAPFLLGDGIPHDKIQTRNLLFGVVDSPVNRTPTSEGFQAGPLPLGKPTTPPKHVQNDPVGFPSDPSSGTSL
uniref:Uncharacterized protein n=1 Tax=Coccidioides posadasii RMSCC 3488 TaxID=454284 RepID=A0A0J6F7U3_COCPO|nr:hypothetical protein CPAG_01717 [Coccidioides posadasii RMSCC 3488]